MSPFSSVYEQEHTMYTFHRNDLKPMVNLMGADEHVPEIDKIIWAVKERCRDTRHSLPFMRLPFILTINILLNNVKLLGYFHTTSVILTTVSPRAIMTGETLNYKSHTAIPFGQYNQMHKEEAPSNIKIPRTRVAICMVPSINNQSRLKFMTLGSKKNVVRQS